MLDRASTWVMIAVDDQSEWRRGWRILLGAMLGMSAGVGLFAPLMGLFIAPLHSALGWSRGQISIATLALILTSLAGPLVGQIVDKQGSHRLILIGTILFALAYMMLAMMPGSFGIYCGIILFIGLAAGPLSSPLVVTRPLVDAFVRSRGLALALGMSGSSVVAALIVPPLNAIILTWGWRAGYGVMAPVTLIFGGSAYLLLKQAPKSDRMLPASVSHCAADEAPDSSFSQALVDRRFWLLSGSVVANSLINGAFSLHLQPLAIDLGTTTPNAALISAWFWISIVAGRIVAGALMDKTSPIVVSTIFLIGPTVGLLLFTPGSPFPVLGLGATLVGLAMGAQGDMLGFFVARFFGLRSFGTIYGLLGLFFGVAMAVAGVGAGLYYDHFGNYLTLLPVGSIVGAISTLLMLVTGYAHRSAMRRRRLQPSTTSSEVVASS